MTLEYKKPLPRIPGYEEPFWKAAKERRLVLQRCEQCSKLRYPMSPVCPDCLSDNHQWLTLSGKGKVTSWVIYHQSFHPGFNEELPYNVAWVELEEGPRLTSNIIVPTNEDIFIDMPVEAVFEDATEDVTLIKFKPSH